jgi:hypothetical protein
MAALSVGLRFPEPFFWTTRPFERLQRLDPGASELAYREHFFFAQALEVYSAPPSKVRIVAEGDSWFAHPCITDITDWLPDHNYQPYGDEIHPTNEAFHDITVRIVKALAAASKRQRPTLSARRRPRVGTARRTR